MPRLPGSPDILAETPQVGMPSIGGGSGPSPAYGKGLANVGEAISGLSEVVIHMQEARNRRDYAVAKVDIAESLNGIGQTFTNLGKDDFRDAEQKSQKMVKENRDALAKKYSYNANLQQAVLTHYDLNALQFGAQLKSQLATQETEFSVAEHTGKVRPFILNAAATAKDGKEFQARIQEYEGALGSLDAFLSPGKIQKFHDEFIVDAKTANAEFRINQGDRWEDIERELKLTESLDPDTIMKLEKLANTAGSEIRVDQAYAAIKEKFINKASGEFDYSGAHKELGNYKAYNLSPKEAKEVRDLFKSELATAKEIRTIERDAKALSASDEFYSRLESNDAPGALKVLTTESGKAIDGKTRMAMREAAQTPISEWKTNPSVYLDIQGKLDRGDITSESQIVPSPELSKRDAEAFRADFRRQKADSAETQTEKNAVRLINDSIDTSGLFMPKNEQTLRYAYQAVKKYKEMLRKAEKEGKDINEFFDADFLKDFIAKNKPSMDDQIKAMSEKAKTMKEKEPSIDDRVKKVLEAGGYATTRENIDNFLMNNPGFE